MCIRDREYAPLYERYGLGTTVWSPLCSGVLTGKYNDGLPDGSRATLDGYQWLARNILSDKGQARVKVTGQLAELAQELGLSVTHLALAWTRLNPNASTTILGASSPQQLRDNLGAVDAVDKLTEDVVARIETILHATPGLE